MHPCGDRWCREPSFDSFHGPCPIPPIHTHSHPCTPTCCQGCCSCTSAGHRSHGTRSIPFLHAHNVESIHVGRERRGGREGTAPVAYTSTQKLPPPPTGVPEGGPKPSAPPPPPPPTPPPVCPQGGPKPSLGSSEYLGGSTAGGGRCTQQGVRDTKGQHTQPPITRVPSAAMPRSPTAATLFRHLPPHLYGDRSSWCCSTSIRRSRVTTASCT